MGVEEDEETSVQIPINFTGYKFAMSIVEDIKDVGGTLLVTFDPSYFFTGQTQDAINYDIAEGNPPGTTQDELHIYVPSIEMRHPHGQYVYDLESKDLSGDIFTRIVGSFTIYPDVTRNIVYNG